VPLCDRPVGSHNVSVANGGKSLNAEFFWNGERGSIHVDCLSNADPEFWGCWHSAAEGFPVCTCTVDYPAHGYRSMLGWVQLVCSTDNESAALNLRSTPSGFSEMLRSRTAGTANALRSLTRPLVRSDSRLNGLLTAS
jgi:hypothetical protein